MSISGSLTGTDESAEFTPSESLSDVVLESPGAKGQVFLMAKAPNTGWKVLEQADGSFAVATPDPAIVYKFVSKNLRGTANYYMGP